MPGINLISVKDQSSNLAAKFEHTQLNMKHDWTYKERIFIENDRITIGYNGYDEYPIRFCQYDNYFVILEGMIYNIPRSEVDSFILDLLSQNRLSSISIAEARKFLFSLDGEFVIVIYDKLSEDLIILNDLLGRLPLYYYKDDQQFLLSREVKFITSLMSHVKLDRLAVAEYLLLRYPLGKRTLVENVNRLECATLLKYNVNSGILNIDKVHEWNLGDKFDAGSLQEYASNLVKLFRSAIKHRSESLKGFKNLVSLSGGLDSRGVAVALKEVDPTFTAVTFLDHEKGASEDVDVTKEFVQKLHIDWELIRLEKRTFEDLKRLIELKDGLNYAYMGYILDFFVKVRHKFGGKVFYYTGDGGDKTLPSDLWLKKAKSIDELTNMLIHEQSAFGRAFPINEVLELSNINMEQIRKEIMNILLSYPEKDLNLKYAHYVIFERANKLLFEGEDRNRYYFWSTSPYYSLGFFDYAMKIPDKYKQHFELYRIFLETLDKRCLEIRNANWPRVSQSFGSLSYFLFPRVQEIAVKYLPFLPKDVQKRIQTTKEDSEYDPNKKIENYQQMRIPSYLSEYMSLNNVKKKLSTHLSEGKFFTLISVVLYAVNLEDRVLATEDRKTQRNRADSY